MHLAFGQPYFLFVCFFYILFLFIRINIKFFFFNFGSAGSLLWPLDSSLHAQASSSCAPGASLVVHRLSSSLIRD